jgi:hypothetical protein
LKVIIHNTGKSVAKNTEATATLVPERSNARILPSPYEKVLVWDDGKTLKNIPAKNKAVLILVFSDEFFFTHDQQDNGQRVPDDERVRAKIATANSFADLTTIFIQFQEDALRRGDTYLSLHVATEDGYSDSAVYRFSVGRDWRDISIERA